MSLTLVDLAEDDHAGKLRFGITGDGRVEDVYSYSWVSKRFPVDDYIAGVQMKEGLGFMCHMSFESNRHSPRSSTSIEKTTSSIGGIK